MTTLDKIAEEVRAHAQRPALAALAANLLARLAESELRHLSRGGGPAHPRGGPLARGRELPLRQNLEILERGPRVRRGPRAGGRASRHALGGDLPGARRAEVMDAWTNRALWLATHTRYPVFACVDRLLESHAADAYWEKVGARLLLARATPADAARAAAWCAALRASTSTESSRILAGQGRRRPTARCAPWPLRRLRAAQGAHSREGPRGACSSRRLPRGAARHQRVGLAGVAGARAGLRGHAAPRGHRAARRRRARGVGQHAAVGREVRSARATYPLRSVRAASREVRYPRAHLLVGAVALGASLLVGGLWVAEGVRTGETYLLMAGGALIVGGALLDLLLGVLPSAGVAAWRSASMPTARASRWWCRGSPSGCLPARAGAAPGGRWGVGHGATSARGRPIHLRPDADAGGLHAAAHGRRAFRSAPPPTASWYAAPHCLIAARASCGHGLVRPPARALGSWSPRCSELPPMWTRRTRVVRHYDGDLSSPHGGRHDRHGSHRAGRDADVIFYATDAAGTPTRGRGWLAYDRFGAAREPLEGGRPGRVFLLRRRPQPGVRARAAAGPRRAGAVAVRIERGEGTPVATRPCTSRSVRRSIALARSCARRAAGTHTPTTSTCASRAG